MRELLAQMLNGLQPAPDALVGRDRSSRYPAAIVDLLQADGGFVRDGAWYSAAYLLAGLGLLFLLARGRRLGAATILLTAGALRRRRLHPRGPGVQRLPAGADARADGRRRPRARPRAGGRRGARASSASRLLTEGLDLLARPRLADLRSERSMTVMDDASLRSRNLVRSRFTRVVLAALSGAPARSRVAPQADTVFAPTDAPGGDALSDSRDRGRDEVPARRRPATSRRCGSTSSRTTRARTSATCGPPAASSSPRPRSPTRRASGWQEQPLATPVADHGRHDLRGLLPLGGGPLRASAPATSRRPVGSGALAGAGRRQRRLPLRRGARRSPTRRWNATNYWVDATFSTTRAGGHARARGRRPSRPPTAPPTRRPRPRRRSPSTSRWPPLR